MFYIHIHRLDVIRLDVATDRSEKEFSHTHVWRGGLQHSRESVADAADIRLPDTESRSSKKQ